MHKLAEKYIKEQKLTNIEGQKELLLQDLEVGMTLCTPILKTPDCQRLVLLSKEYVEFKNGVRHVVANCTQSQTITVCFDESKGRHIAPKFIFQDPDGNTVLFPDYVGYFPKGSGDELIVYWINGDELVGDDPETLSRFVVAVEKRL